MPPPVAKRRELRRSHPRMQLDRDLPHVEVLTGRPDHHLGGELHADRAHVEHRHDAPSERAHAAVGVTDVRPVQSVEDAREQRIAQPAQPGHGAGLQTLHAVPEHELSAVVELLHEARDLAEVVGEIGVDHDDVVALGGREPRQIRAPVATPPLLDDRGAGGSRKLAAPVGRAVVDDDHLTRETALLEHGASAADALADRLRLVQTRDDDGDARRRRFSVTVVAMRLRGYARVRVCIVYDCLFPYTIGGAERWYRNLAERLAAAGNDVTVPDPSPVGARRRAGGSGRPHRRRGPQDEALRSQRATASAAPDRLRPGSARPSPPSRSTLRHRAHGVVPVLLAPGHSRDTQAEQIPGRRRLARGVDPRLLARVPRALRRPDRLVDSARVPSRAAACLLLLEVARAPPARARAPRRADAPRRAVRRAARAVTAPARATGRRLRGAP